ncbi:5'(3')-deoxyribonucleotidase [Chryseobacterium shigense]|uniref:5'(3')-deoxyribonucleotidase n=1 Tax=Chryseobacterium shigense TaxID=297244 RepID=A0A1N7IQR4_9FLAO|nr:5'(3')-deoxyribonucleotidase [Chryseobacterium shigense]PQA95605.1 5'(3')-deoxyribonucleotidase [Chryseobacterium shigense]SIS39413.1 5'(3')-deoxyribonucleotidase [Chryseobacterium shigense]
MKRIIVDMDGVMADVYHQLVQFEKRDSGREIEVNGLVGIPEIEAFPNGKKHVNEVGFFRTLPVMEGSREALEYINSKYELYIVSAGMEFPNSLREKFDWLAEHFPFISWEQIVLCGSKKVVHGDVMIDDYPKNLDHFAGEKIIFTQPHNKLIENENYKRVHSWEDIMKIL